MSAAVERLLMARARRQRGLLHQRDLCAATGRPDEVRRRVRTGGWQEVLPGVIAPTAIAVDRTVRECAAMLWVPAGGLSHYSAARRDGIWVPEDADAWVTSPWSDGLRSRSGIQVVRTRHPPERWSNDGFLRWTPAARTVVDLAQCLDERTLSAVLLSAIRHHKTAAPEVAAAAAPLGGRAGLAVLSRVLGLWTPERESLLEDELHADALSVAQEITVERQYDVRDRSGRLIGRADVAVPELRLAFEADGLLFHSTDTQIAADQRRDRRFMGVGWQTARFREGVHSDRALVRRDLRDIIEARRRQPRVA